MLAQKTIASIESQLNSIELKLQSGVSVKGQPSSIESTRLSSFNARNSCLELLAARSAAAWAQDGPDRVQQKQAESPKFRRLGICTIGRLIRDLQWTASPILCPHQLSFMQGTNAMSELLNSELLGSHSDTSHVDEQMDKG